MSFGTKTMVELGRTLERNLKKEMRDQGHFLTGDLEKSIKTVVSGDSPVVAETQALEYIQDLETGLAPNQIDFSATYIQEMAAYAQKRMGLRGKEALKVGYRIARKHSKEGMPTKNSYQFSNNGYRTKGITESYNDHEREFNQQLEDGVSEEIDQVIDFTFLKTTF